ncbi:hypothetical protein TrRE_jg7967 [Triparma retinervis]|uniref:UMP/CMP kinase n=1 Tax=Triparma retinervis TaxID=2557542 RepID=A0A9W7FFU9_9STRA|nr:hypothetical protein TrRE_jg7967 [Triparma retinervis]
MRSRAVFVLGGPGAGKGTQCAKMVEHFDFVHLSVGDLLREERAKSPPSENAELIESFLKEGKLVPVSISLALVREAMEREKEGSVFLIDGFPRNGENLDGWKEAMEGVVNVCGVLVYDCPIQELQRRILSRGETSGRSDDNLESAKKRFKTFERDTMPVVRRMEEGGIKSVHIRGENKLERVWESVVASDVIGGNGVEWEKYGTNESGVEAIAVQRKESGKCTHYLKIRRLKPADSRSIESNQIIALPYAPLALHLTYLPLAFVTTLTLLVSSSDSTIKIYQPVLNNDGLFEEITDEGIREKLLPNLHQTFPSPVLTMDTLLTPSPPTSTSTTSTTSTTSPTSSTYHVSCGCRCGYLCLTSYDPQSPPSSSFTSWNIDGPISAVQVSPRSPSVGLTLLVSSLSGYVCVFSRPSRGGPWGEPEVLPESVNDDDPVLCVCKAPFPSLSGEALFVGTARGKGWSGQTETLIPTFNRVMLDTEQAENRVAILSASIPTFTAKVQELASDDAKFGDVSNKGCSPLFLVVRFGKAVGMVEGANSPALVELITEQIPELKEDDE